MKKNLCFLLWVLMMMSCVKPTPKYVIGVSQCSEDIWRDKQNRELQTAKYVHDDVELRFASAYDNDHKQIEQIDRFVKDKVDLLIVSPNQVNTITPAVDRAYDAGIPVILFDRKTSSHKYSAFVGADNYLIGKTMGQLIAHDLGGKGTVVEIKGLKGSSPAIERHRGFAEALSHYPAIRLISSDLGDWTEKSGDLAMRTVMAQTKDIDVVFGHNDRLAAGARNAIEAKGIKSGVRYYGVDGLPGKDNGIDMVRTGKMEATYIYPTRGTELLQLAMDILQKKPFKKDNVLESAIVTKENAEVLHLQNAEIDKQSGNIETLHGQLDNYFERMNSQQIILLLFVLIIALLVGGAVLLYRSVLDKSRLNDRLVGRNAELQRLTKEIEGMTNAQLVFFTNVSHELRTPLTLISGPVEQLLQSPDIKGDNRNLLSFVSRNVKILNELVNDILDFRKVQNGKMQLKLSRFDLNDLLQSMTGDFSNAAQNNRIKLTYQADHDGACDVTADKEKVGRVFLNLMSNALKYTPAGGRIEVKLSHDADSVRFSVFNTGMGIAPDELPHLFERFFQTRRSSGGTGIGLALAKAFCELHHGTINAESVEGQHATFTVTMSRRQEGDISDDSTTPTISKAGATPELRPADNARTVQVVSGEDDDRPTVLVIDDNHDVRTYVHSILQDNYRVIDAADGKNGLETARRDVPDLVVSDVMMPMMDGMEFTSQLKQDPVTSHIPVILLTARTLEEQRIEGYEHGADAYLTKPFTAKLLLARIENLLKSRAMLRSIYEKASVSESGENLFEHQPQSHDNGTAEHEEQFIGRLRTIIQDNLADNNLSVEKIGEEMGLSRVQLYRKVKALTGLSPVELLRKARLNRGRRLLETTDKTISEVAYDVGFSAPSYFTKCFKDEFGMAPGELKP